MKKTTLRVLYIVYWGASEPLGQSLVVPAVKRLAALGVDLTLISFEKSRDLDQPEFIRDIRRDLEINNVTWVPLRYHKHPKVPATLFDVLQGVARAVQLRMSGRYDIVHARTFVGGLMGLVVAPLIRAKLIYHNEGFYPDEQVDSGVWKAESRAHRIAKWLERRMYSLADAVISISHHGRRDIQMLAAVKERRTPVEVVPSCVDLDLFKGPPLPSDGQIRLVYSGSVGGRYVLDRIGRFVATARKTIADLHLQVLTRSEPDLVAQLLHTGGLSDDHWSLDSVSYPSMPNRLARASAGVAFLAQGLSEHASSPTKIGEYWAMGLPVVTTPNVTDIDQIIERERVGVIVQGHSDADYTRAAEELKTLLKDPDLAKRCRRAAEQHYALGSACERQYRLYLRIINPDRKEEHSQRDSQEAA